MDIFLESRIWEWSFDEFKYDIENSSDKNIDVYIACIGGNVDAGFAMANYIDAINASGSKTIKTHILSNADSIATVIFLAANERTIVQSSTMFVHQPRFLWIEDVTSDVADEAAESLRIQEERIANYYTQKIPNLDKKEALDLMSGNTTLSAEKMLEFGIVSEVKESFNIAAIKSKTNMSLFGKKEKPLQNISLKQGDDEVLAIHRGELAENVELERIGDGEALNGEFVTNEQKVTIENNKVTAIEAIEAQKEEAPEMEAVVAEKVAEAVSPLMEQIEALTEKLANVKSTHKPQKGNVDNSSKEVDPQKEARRASKERQAENLKKRQELNAKKLGL